MKKSLKFMVTALIVMLIATSVFTVSYAADEETYVGSVTLTSDELLRVGMEFPYFYSGDDANAYMEKQWYKSAVNSKNLSDFTKCDTNIIEEGYNYIYSVAVTPMWKKYFNNSTSFKLVIPNRTYQPIYKSEYDVKDSRLNDGYTLRFFISKDDIGCTSVRTVDELRTALGSEDNLNIRINADIKYEIPRGGKSFEPITVNKTKSLDLNGHSIEVVDKTNVDKSSDFTCSSDEVMFRVASGAELTVDDTVGDGSIRFNGDMIDVHMWALFFWDHSFYNNYATRDIFHINGGKLTVNGGSFYAGSAKKQYLQDKVVYAHQIVTGTPVTVATGEVVINGGHFEGYSVVEAGPGMANTIFVSEKAKVTINGGYFKLMGTGHVVIGIPKINGGTFVAETYDHIRTLQTSSTSNNYTDGKIGKYNIHDDSWHESLVDVYEGTKFIEYNQGYGFSRYTGTDEIRFVKQTVSGGISFTSGVAVGKSITVTLTGNIAEIYKNNPGAVSFEWMSAQAGTSRWISEEETTKDFTPTAYHNGRDLRLAITVDGMNGKLYSSRVRVTKQSQDFGAPPTKAGAEVNYANAQITISDYSSAQEYVLTESAATPDWATAIRPDDGGVFRNLTKEKIYYIHTRYKETSEKAAGSKVVYTVVDLRQQVYLTGIELEAEKVYAAAYTYVKITAKPIPANATNFEGVLGSKWILNSGTGSTAKLYATLRGVAINADSYYKSVYLYGTKAETVNVSAEMTIGYNNVVRDAVTVERADQNGRYAFSDSEISYRPGFNGTSHVTLNRGTSAVVSLVNNDSGRGDKPIDEVTWSKNGGDTLVGISFMRIEGTNQVLVKASDTCTTGTERFNCVVNGVTMINKLVVKVVDAEIPAESISLDKLSLALKKGEGEDLYAKVLPVNSTDNVVWTSSNTAVATVSGGRVTAKAEGVAEIRATAGDYSTVCKVTVCDEEDTYAVNVTFGTASAQFAKKGQKVTVAAADAPENCAFDKWFADGISLSSPNSSTVSFLMPEGDVSLTATYKVAKLGKTSEIQAIQNTSAIRLTWKPVPGAEGYSVYLKTSGGWKNLGVTRNTTATLGGLSAGTKYTYAVRAGWTKNGQVQWSSVYTIIDTATQTVAPSKIAAAQNTSAIKLAWTKCAGATGYRIYYYAGGKWNVALSTTTATSHTFYGLKAGAKYLFAVRPYIISGKNVIWSGYTQYTTCTKPDAPVSKVTTPSSGKISLTWNPVNGADGYQVYYSLNGGAYKLYGTFGSVRTFNFTGLKTGAKYTFAVRAGIRTSGGNIFGGYTPVTVTVK